MFTHIDFLCSAKAGSCKDPQAPVEVSGSNLADAYAHGKLRGEVVLVRWVKWVKAESNEKYNVINSTLVIVLTLGEDIMETVCI